MAGPFGTRPAQVSMPKDVGTAQQLWWSVIGLGVVYLVASIVALFTQRRVVAEDLIEQARAQGTALTMASAESMVTLAFVVVALVGLAFTALALVIVRQFARGKRWARTVLTVFGVWAAVTGVGALVVTESAAGIAALVAGGVSIVQAVFAVGAIYLSHRPDSAAYFQPGRH
ncbi:hypothetical protein [Nocardia sp. CNY236]|uniref:hypothetical protein n=1 Tax=Nocardia sp. CNY236 TaxID=1169152 RepID=UPI0009DFDE82|nr:hypothetical protein [Nocardia sp. CNY236]